MTAAFQPRTTGPAYLSGSRFASCRRAPRFRNTRPAKRVAGRKTAPRNFFRATPKPRRELLPQVTGTHLESRTYRYVFAPGCVVAPNNAAVLSGPPQISLAPISRPNVDTFHTTFPGNYSLLNLFNGNAGEYIKSTAEVLAVKGPFWVAARFGGNATAAVAANSIAWAGTGLTIVMTAADIAQGAVNGMAVKTYEQNASSTRPEDGGGTYVGGGLIVSDPFDFLH
jgi:hypothetical protein